MENITPNSTQYIMENVASNNSLYIINGNMKELLIRTITLLFLFLSVVVNGSCIVVLTKCQHLNGNRFYRLTIYHSICNVGTCFSAAFAVCLSLAKSEGVFCILNYGILTGSIMCSLYQTLLITIYQVSLLFDLHYSNLNKLFRMSSILISYGIIIIFNVVVYFQFGTTQVHECTLRETTKDNTLIFLTDIPAIALSSLIFLGYFVVIGKTVKRYKQVQPLSNNTTKKLKKYGVTLGCVIVVSFISIFPTSVYSIASLSKMVTMGQDVRRYTNIMYIIEVISDPIIYILRIRKFRIYLCRICCNAQSPNAVVQNGVVDQPF